MSKTPIASAAEGLRERCAAIAREETGLREGGGKAARTASTNGSAPRARAHQPRSTKIRLFSSWGCGPLTRCISSGAIFPPRALLPASAMSRAFLHDHRERRDRKAGAFFPATAKKLIPRATRRVRICSADYLSRRFRCVFLPMQTRFPDEDDFGRIFRNNSVISAAGLRSSPRSWAIASRAAHISPCCATKF